MIGYDSGAWVDADLGDVSGCARRGSR